MRERKDTTGRREWLSKIPRGFLLGCLAFSFLLIPAPFLVLSADGNSLFIPLSEGKRVYYSYLHSYTLFPVEDCWIFKRGKLYLFGERTFSGGAGNPAGEEVNFFLERG